MSLGISREKCLSWLFLLGVYVLWPLLAAVITRGYLAVASVNGAGHSLVPYICAGLLVSLTIIVAHSYRILSRHDLHLVWKVFVLIWVVTMPALVCGYPQLARIANVRNWKRQSAPISALGGLVNKRHGEWDIGCIGKGLDDKAFEKWLPKLIELEVENLSLANSEVSDELISELAHVASLKTLDLTGTKVEDGALEELSKLRNLEVLILSNTLVTDVGMHSLAKSRSIKRLYIENCNVTSESLEALRELSSLQYLDITGTGVDIGAKNSFVDAMPKVSVFGPDPSRNNKLPTAKTNR